MVEEYKPYKYEEDEEDGKVSTRSIIHTKFFRLKTPVAEVCKQIFGDIQVIHKRTAQDYLTEIEFYWKRMTQHPAQWLMVVEQV